MIVIITFLEFVLHKRCMFINLIKKTIIIVYVRKETNGLVKQSRSVLVY